MSPTLAKDPVKRAERADRLSDDDILAALTEIADELDVLNPRQAALWRARLILYHEARSRDDRLVITALAAAARVSTVAVITALKKPDPLDPAEVLAQQG